MKNNYEVKKLKPIAAEYIAGFTGIEIINNSLIEKIKNEKISVFAPKNISDEELYDFEYGDKVKHSAATEYLSETILDKLSKNSNKKWIIEDNNGNVKYSTEMNSIEDLTDVFYYNKSVFHTISKPDINENDIENTIKYGGAYPFIGFITEISPEISQSISANSVTVSQFEQIRNNISFFVAGIYDEESYLFIEMI